MTEQDARGLVEILNKHSPLVHLETVVSALLAMHADMILSAERYSDPRSLGRYRAQVYSQNGEDGIIAEIMRRIGTTNKHFVEIGAGDGDENNTRLLVENGWTGIWLESDPANVATIRETYASEIVDGRLTLISSSATRENVARSLADEVGPDLLSVDIDANTSHVWRALKHLRPRVAVIEYNPAFGPVIDWEITYRPDATWNGDNQFGASLCRLETIGRELGYGLVGCDITGVNAFFVRDDLLGEKFHPPFTSLQHFEPARFALLQCTIAHPQAKRPRKQQETAP